MNTKLQAKSATELESNKLQRLLSEVSFLGNIFPSKGRQFKTLNDDLVAKMAREKIGQHFVLADKDKTTGVCKRQSLWPTLAILGNILSSTGRHFQTLNGHLGTKMEREKHGRHFVLADKKKTQWFASINLSGHLGQHLIISGHLITKTAREQIGQHFVLADKEKTKGVASINLFGHFGQHLTRQGTTFETLSGHLVTKTAREQIGQHFVFADKKKTQGFAGINLFGHLGQHHTRQGTTFETLSGHFVTKTAREKIGQHFVLADKEKQRGLQASISLAILGNILRGKGPRLKS